MVRSQQLVEKDMALTYLLEKKYSNGMTAFGAYNNINDENRIFNRARRDKYRQYIEDLKNGEFLKNYKKTNKAFYDVTTNAILNYRKQYSPEDLFKLEAGRRYLRKMMKMTPIYGAFGASHLARGFNKDFTAAKWNRDKRNPYKESHKLVESGDYVYSKKNPVLDIDKSEFENRVAYKRYLEDQKKKKEKAEEKLRSKYYD